MGSRMSIIGKLAVGSSAWHRQIHCGKLCVYHLSSANSQLKLRVYHRQIVNGTPCVCHRHIHCVKLCVYHPQIHNGKLCACHRQIHCGKSTIGKLAVGSLSSAYSLCGSWCLSIVNVLWEAVCLSSANLLWEAVCLSLAYSLCEAVCISPAKQSGKLCLSTICVFRTKPSKQVMAQGADNNTLDNSTLAGTLVCLIW